MPGVLAFTALAMSKYALPGRSGWMPPCMHTSVAPAAHASSARSATCSTLSVYASASVLRWAKAQKRQPV
ncbi:hypothetical protein GCM10020220_063460 [Nonomuraea rubra]